MYILDLTNPLVLLAAVLIYALLMILGKEFKNSKLPAISLFLFLIILAIYAVQLFMAGNAETNKFIVACIGYNAILISYHIYYIFGLTI